MARIREFYLKNKFGEELDFQIPNKQLLVNPNGLGWSNNNIYLNVQGRKLLQYTEPNIPTFTGTIILANAEAYDRYRDFIEFISKNDKDEPLQLLYTPRYETKSKVQFISNCFIDNVSKGELSGETLTINLSITRTTFWFTELQFQAIQPDTNAGKIYGYDYGFIYGSGSSGEVTINNDSNEKAPIEFEIIGEATNPVIQIQDLAGNIISEIEVFDSITTDEKIFINTEILQQYIIKTDLSNNEIESSQSMYQKFNFDKNLFPLLPIGFSKIVFQNDIIDAGTLIIRFRQLERSV